MRSPFPGMDPYIEVSHLWEDFHAKFIGEIERALSGLVPDRYVVRAGERSYVGLVDSLDDEEDGFLPDVTVATSEPGPVRMQALVPTEYREAFLEIRQVDPERKLVTGIEVVSPSNKRRGTEGWRLYYRKRRAFLSGYANFVEIDLVRRGRRLPMASPWPDSPYYLLVCRKREAPRCSVWPAFFDRLLPPIPIPLAPPDPDIMLALQPLVEAVYARSHYERDIDYRQPLHPPLTPAQVAWLEKRLRKRQGPG